MASESGWRPIETAPKNGRTIVVTDGEEAATAHCWTDHDDDGTRTVDWVDAFNDHIGFTPTHWTEPPRAEERSHD